MMRYLQIIDGQRWFSFSASLQGHPRRRLSALLFQAVYGSRRAQADRTLYRYRDLIDRAKQNISSELDARIKE
jgi:hypothetical protein